MKTIAFFTLLPALVMVSACNSRTSTTIDSDNGASMMMNGIDVNGANIVEIPGGENMMGDAPPDDADLATADGNMSATAATASVVWTGHWTGVEGMVLDIAADPDAGRGHYILKMRWGLDPDMAGSFGGVLKDGAIHFTRPDGDHVLKPGSGEETGLKYLAGKSDCLVVKTGEGYCRD